MSSKTLYLVLTGLALAGCDEAPVSPLTNEGDAPNPDIGVVLDRRHLGAEIGLSAGV